MDHVLANSEKPIPEANDDEEEVASLESGEAAKVRSLRPRPLLLSSLNSRC